MGLLHPVCSVKVQVAQSCPALCNPMDYRVHGILQARTLEWVAFPFSRGSSQPRDRTQVSRIAGRFFTSWATRDALKCRCSELQLSLASQFQHPFNEDFSLAEPPEPHLQARTLLLYPGCQPQGVQCNILIEMESLKQPPVSSEALSEGQFC